MTNETLKLVKLKQDNGPIIAIYIIIYPWTFQYK